MAKTIAVLNQKGGVGKTTTVINVATYLAKAGRSVLVVDFDPQGNATSGLGIDKQTVPATIREVMFGQALVDQAILESAVVPNLAIIPANAQLANAEVDLVDKPGRERYLQKALGNLTHDIVLIDCPPSLGLLTVNALTAADYLLIPVQAEYYALEGLSQLLSVVQRVRESLNTNLELLGVIVTMYDSRTSLSASVYQELKQYFGDKLFKTIVPRNVRLAEAPSFGLPIAEHDRWSKGARAYKQLTKEISQHVS